MITSYCLIISSISLTYATKVWPKGQYCLPMPTNQRCPFGWENGYRLHTTEGNNTIQGDAPYSVSSGKKLDWGFCCKTRVRYSRYTSWPKGSYCIFRKGGFCPREFREGSIYWDDKDKQSENIAKGTLPDGVYDQNTQIYFCCREDGSHHLAGFPRCNSLILMRYGGTCPVIEGYLGAYDGYINWNTQKRFNNDQGIFPYPDGFSGFRSAVKIQFCSYTSSYSC